LDFGPKATGARPGNMRDMKLTSVGQGAGRGHAGFSNIDLAAARFAGEFGRLGRM